MSLETYRLKSGLISYTVKFRYRGVTYRRACGPVTRTVAKRMEREYRVEVAEGRYRTPSPPKVSPTLDAFTPRFLAWYQARRRPGSAKTYLARLNNHLLPYLGERPVTQLTTAVLDDYGTRRRQEGANPRTVNGEYTVLSALLNRAVEWGELTKAAKPTIHWLDEEEIEIRVLTPEEEMVLLKAADPRLRLLIRFALQTGLRRDELRYLTWQHIDEARREVVVSSERAKNRRTRRIPLNAAAWEVLDAVQRTGDTRHGRLFGYRSISQAFDRAVKKAGLPGVNCHSLRHTWATRCLERGINVRTVQKWLGHQDLRMTMKYAHPNQDHERQAIELLGSLTVIEPDAPEI